MNRGASAGRTLLLLRHVEGRAVGEGDGVGGVEGLEVDGPHAQPQPDGHQCAEKLAVGIGIECRGRQQVVALLAAQMADLSDEVVRRCAGEPRPADAPDAVAAVLPQEEAAGALQLLPEGHEAGLGVFDVHFCFEF